MSKVDSRAPSDASYFQYSGRDKLVQVTQGTSGTVLGQFDYNYDGNRIRHRFSDRGNVDYFYDDGSVLVERNADDDSLLAHYQYADRLIALAQPLGKQYYHHDALGSTIGLTDAAGADKKSYRLDPWGNIRAQSGTSDNRHIFTGQEHDPNTGLVYFGARYYDPEVGRFITQDAYLGEPNTPPSLHRYLYAHSNPTVYTDPTGNFAIPESAIQTAATVVSKDKEFEETADKGIEVAPDASRPGDAYVDIESEDGSEPGGEKPGEYVSPEEASRREADRVAEQRMLERKRVDPVKGHISSRKVSESRRPGESSADYQQRKKSQSLGRKGCKDRICGDINAMRVRERLLKGPENPLNPFSWVAHAYEIAKGAITGADDVTPDLQDATVAKAAEYTYNVGTAGSVLYGAVRGILRKAPGTANAPFRFSSTTNRWHGPDGRFVKKPTAQQLRDWATKQGWSNTKTTAAGFETWTDAAGVRRMKIKPPSTQQGLGPGSKQPRVTLWNAEGKRVDGFGRNVTKKSVTAHAPIEWRKEAK